MPYKYAQSQGYHDKEPRRQKKRNWSKYNKRMTLRGDITIWLSPDMIGQWYVANRDYKDEGAPKLYSDMAILTIHEIRQVFKLPLRQCEGFINALFKLLKVDLRCPNFSTLSRRLKTLKLKQPFYRFAHSNADDVKMIAIDSTGLKCYGQDEWALEKYGKERQKRGWRKLHIAVDHHHIIQTTELTNRVTQDVEVVDDLIEPMPDNVNHVTADTAYDANRTYHSLEKQFSRIDIVILPRKGSKYTKQNAR